MADITSGSSVLGSDKQTQPQTFKEILDRLTEFNISQGDTKDIEAPIGGLNEVVIRLDKLNTGLQTMLSNIQSEVSKMRPTNLSASKKKISDMTSSMSKSLNAIEQLVPIVKGTSMSSSTDSSTSIGATNDAKLSVGGFKYSKSKSRTPMKSKKYTSKYKRNNSRRKTHRR